MWSSWLKFVLFCSYYMEMRRNTKPGKSWLLSPHFVFLRVKPEREYTLKAVCVCWRIWGVGGYILVMLTAFYKLWLTPLATADWILNKQSQVAEFSRVRAEAGEALLHQHGASSMRPPHQPVLFLAAAVERGSPWGGWLYGVCLW